MQITMNPLSTQELPRGFLLSGLRYDAMPKSGLIISDIYQSQNALQIKLIKQCWAASKSVSCSNFSVNSAVACLELSWRQSSGG